METKNIRKQFKPQLQNPSMYYFKSARAALKEGNPRRAFKFFFATARWDYLMMKKADPSSAMAKTAHFDCVQAFSGGMRMLLDAGYKEDSIHLAKIFESYFTFKNPSGKITIEPMAGSELFLFYGRELNDKNSAKHFSDLVFQ